MIVRSTENVVYVSWPVPGRRLKLLTQGCCVSGKRAIIPLTTNTNNLDSKVRNTALLSSVCVAKLLFVHNSLSKWVAWSLGFFPFTFDHHLKRDTTSAWFVDKLDFYSRLMVAAFHQAAVSGFRNAALLLFIQCLRTGPGAWSQLRPPSPPRGVPV